MTTPSERFEDLVARHGPVVLGYLARRTEPRADAADLHAEVLTITWRKLRAVPRDDDAARAWMLAVARRCLANHRRGHARRHRLAARLREEVRAVPASEPDPRAERILAGLSEEDRELVTLVYWEGLTTASAAQVLGISAAAGRKRLERIRARARAEDYSSTDYSSTR